MRPPRGFAIALLSLIYACQTAHAAEVVLPQTLSGGGSGGSTWIISNSVGTTNGLPTGGFAFSVPGFGVNDATLGTNQDGDVFDNGLLIFVNNAQFTAPGSVSRVGSTLTAGPVAMSGANVTIEYAALADSATLRTLARFQNPTADPLHLSVVVASNWGADEFAAIANTSSGDTLFTVGDNWLLTFDTSGYDPAITSVFAGPGGAVLPSGVGLTVFSSSSTHGVLTAYDLTLPAGGARSLLLFTQLNETVEAAQAGVGVFNTTPNANNSLLTGLDAARLAEVANWNFPAAPSVPPGQDTLPPVAANAPEPGTLALMLISLLAGVSLTRRRCR